MDEPDVLYRVDDGIAVVTLNRPGQRNPLTERPMVDGIVDALARANDDRGVRVVVLTGAGPAFSAGGNVKAMAAALEERRADPVRTQDYYRQGVQRIPLAFQGLEVPAIAAVNGPAVGAGCDLACMCDIRIASEKATFAESFVKLGIVPGDGGAWLLQRIVGYSKCCELAFTGDTVDAAEALRIGLVSKVVPDAELIDSALELARRIARNPPDAVRMTKRLLVQAREQSLWAALEAARALQALAHTTAEHADAARAFADKTRR
jgi:enoyl-CoA hydratase/carnithine racemase